MAARNHSRFADVWLSGRWLGIAGALAILAMAIADQNGWLLVRASDDMAAYDGMRTTVQRVIDGDTLDVALPDNLHGRAVTQIVLCGVTCPSPARGGNPAEAWAAEATAFTASSVAQHEIILWLESHHTRDAFGRVLAHVELSDGTQLNEALLAQGLARITDLVAHSNIMRYAQVEESARRRGIGVWQKDE